jgi:pyruvate kinase
MKQSPDLSMTLRGSEVNSALLHGGIVRLGARTKIVATIGPATQELSTLRELVMSGVDVARLNFSYGSYPEFERIINDLRGLSRELSRPIAILQDLQGPKIRVGEMEKGVELKKKSQIIFTTRLVKGNNKIIPVQYEHLPKDVRVGDIIFLDDGLLQVKVQKTNKKDMIWAEVLVGGPLSSNKGMNLPDTLLSAPPLTDKDEKDIQFGAKMNVDYIALSYVRSAKDIKLLRDLIKKANGHAKIVAKIERKEALEKIDEIIDAADALMVARGDLGIEISLDEVPLIQKKLIQKCIKVGKPVIVATQMLDSMIRNPRPTRAEVSDVANAILDGADAVMLSGETALGKYPILAVKVMNQIAVEVEPTLAAHARRMRVGLIERVKLKGADTTDALALAAKEMAEQLNCRFILCSTTGGYTARMIARRRPAAKIIALVYNEKTYYQLALLWGTTPLILPYFHSTDELINQAVDLVSNLKLVEKGDRLVITAGHPPGFVRTNLLYVHVVGQNPHPEDLLAEQLKK